VVTLHAPLGSGHSAAATAPFTVDLYAFGAFRLLRDAAHLVGVGAEHEPVHRLRLLPGLVRLRRVTYAAARPPRAAARVTRRSSRS
jgi:hypothetical protein